MYVSGLDSIIGQNYKNFKYWIFNDTYVTLNKFVYKNVITKKIL